MEIIYSTCKLKHKQPKLYKMILQIRRNKSENAAVKSSSFSARAHGPQIYRVRWFGFIIDGPKKVFE